MFTEVWAPALNKMLPHGPTFATINFLWFSRRGGHFSLLFISGQGLTSKDKFKLNLGSLCSPEKLGSQACDTRLSLPDFRSPPNPPSLLPENPGWRTKNQTRPLAQRLAALVAYYAGEVVGRNCFHCVSSSADCFAWGARILHADSSTARHFPATPGLQ